jgi:hypothetical protein
LSCARLLLDAEDEGSYIRVETQVIYQTTRYHIPEDSTLYNYPVGTFVLVMSVGNVPVLKRNLVVSAFRQQM